MTIRQIWALIAAAILLGSTSAARAIEPNVDRPGSDYNSFDIAPFSGDERTCEAACNREGRCQAWTFVRPSAGFPPTAGRCFLKDRIPAARPNGCCVSGVKEPAGGGEIVPPGARDNTDRPGSDIRDFDLRRADPAICQEACTRDRDCRAWTYVRPGYQGASARCWLKNDVPRSVSNDCCISGENRVGGPGGGEIVPPGARDNTDRPGSDIRDFDLRRADPAICQDACSRERGCRAWTYVRPGYQGASARCWLKNDLPRATSNDCCISGENAAGGPGGGWDDDFDIGPGMRDGMDRPGSDYRSFIPSRREGPAACQNTCEDENECRAWAYKRASGPGDRGRCFLKGVAPAERRDPSVISGVSRNRDTIGRGMDDDTDRPGSDLRMIDLTSADPRQCQRECERDGRCRAWTYVRPGVQAPNARCYLKSPAPGANRDQCCISGLVGPSVPPVSRFLENTRRDGSVFRDYRTFDGAEACRSGCSADGRCGDWMYSKPTRPGRPGRCYLLRPGSTPIPDTCCTSSRGAAGPGGGREVIGPGMRDNTDRPGFDLRPPFPLMAPDPGLCRDACFSEFGCRAWVYSRPGTRHPTRATCTLKSVPGPRVDTPCCITGGRSSLF